MIIRAIILCFFISYALIAQPFQPVPKSPYVSTKARKVQKVLDVVTKLERLARRNANKENGKHVNGYLSQAAINEIKVLLKELPDSEQLTKLALICGHLAYPQDAGDVGYDAVFDWAMWEAAEILSNRTDDEAINGLELLKQSHGRDGHPSEQFTELIEKQRKLKTPARNKRR